MKAPAAGEAQTKTVDGVQFKFCQKCLKGKGMWTTGKSLHSTDEHKFRNKSKNTQQETGNLAMINDGPLEVHF